MTDREKVIKGLECCVAVNCGQACPYATVGGCQVQVLRDAVALLKEQEPVDVIVEPLDDTRYIFCGACRCMLAQGKPKGYKFCPWCGRAVKWDEEVSGDA